MRPTLPTLDYTEEALPIPLARSLVRARVVAAHAPPASHVDPLLDAPSILVDTPALLADAAARGRREQPTITSEARMREALGRGRRGAGALVFGAIAVVGFSMLAVYAAGRYVAPRMTVQLVQ